MSTSRRNALLAAMAAPFAFLSRSQASQPTQPDDEIPPMSGVRYAAYLAQEVLEFERQINKRMKAAVGEYDNIYGQQGISVPSATTPCQMYVRRYDMIAELPEPDISEWVEEINNPLTESDDITMGMGCVVRRCFLERQRVLAPGFQIVDSFTREMTEFERNPRPGLKPVRLITPRWTVDRSELTPRRLAHMVICMYRGLLEELHDMYRSLLEELHDQWSRGYYHEVSAVTPADAVVTRSGPVLDMYAFTDFRCIAKLKDTA